ncbi:Katanin p60 ATPase-containing subunit A1 [Paramecium bursaria]
MSQILDIASVQIKEAREEAFLGKYQEALKKYIDQIGILTEKKSQIPETNLLQRDYANLINLLKEELQVIQTLVNYTKDNSVQQTPSPIRKKANEIPAYQDVRQPRLPFNQAPFTHNQQLQRSPFKQQKEINESPRQKDQKDTNDFFQQQLRNNGPLEKPKTPKDPDVWDPPRKQPNNNKKNPKPQGQKTNQPPLNINSQVKDNKNYEKPWRNNAAPGKKQDQQPSNGNKKSFHDHVYPDGRGPDSDLIQMLEREVVDLSPNVKFEDIAELEQAKEVLQEAVLLPVLMPGVFRGPRRPLKGVMLFGPPGTGKTMLAKAVATIGKTTFFNISASSLASKWRGESEKLVRILFEMAKFYAPTTIFFDEIDALGSRRSDNDGDATRRVKNQLLVEMDGVAATGQGEEKKVIMCLAATNRPWDLDEALIRRLERRIYIPLPTEIGRRALMNIALKDSNVSSDIDWDYLVKKSEGYSGADITNVIREAAMLPIRRFVKAQGGIQQIIGNQQQMNKEIELPLEQKDFEEAFKYVNRSNMING